MQTNDLKRITHDLKENLETDLGVAELIKIISSLLNKTKDKNEELAILYKYACHMTPILTKYVSVFTASDGTVINPFAYLLLNPDVAINALDPADHYERYGKEEGRRTSIM